MVWGMRYSRGFLDFPGPGRLGIRRVKLFGSGNARVLAAIRARFRAFCLGTSGAAVVEFAIIMPLFLLLMLGMIVWGYTLSVTDAMYDAARMAAREIAVGVSTEAEAETTAANYLAMFPQAFSITAEDVGTTGTDEVRVVITVPNALGDIIPLVTSASSLSGEVVMRKE